MKNFFKISGLSFILFCSVFGGEIQDFDESLYSSIHDGWRCDFAENYFSAVTYLGRSDFYLSTNLALLCFGDDKMKESAKLSTASLAASMLTAEIFKVVVNRRRPEGQDVSRWDSSFPSGHTTAAFSMAYVYGAQYPKLRIPLYFFATSVALSRIYLGEHYPGDVAAGAAIGTLFGFVVMKNKNFIVEIGL
ncbi:hypothetical protein DRQ26_05005 [bacterium]|nr:MAG: hypothetical protein DRQ26_05005 [bacterium]